jgi:beta-glucosidase/6-phospho-beta-glucosidase/beta-galactosidase
MGWPVEPDAFREILTTMHKRYGLPIYVTENGTAHADEPAPDGKVPDEPRISYLTAYTAAMFDAIAAGVDVRGYFVGRCWIISNGARATMRASGLSTWIILPSAGCRRIRFAGSRTR